MKKIICLVLSVLIVSMSCFAQDAKTAKAPAPRSIQAQQQSAPTQNTAAPAAKTKKDGTPDMRYKANKEAAKPKQKMKKDGTPDMRHKANKEAAKKN